MRKSPTAAGTRMPLAIVRAGQGSANSLPPSNALTIGAQPSDCTVTMRGRFRTDPAQLLHLVEGLPHADQSRAAARRR